MRIIIRFLLKTGNYNTQHIDIDENISICDFRLKISEKLQISQKKFLIKFKRDGYKVKK